MIFAGGSAGELSGSVVSPAGKFGSEFFGEFRNGIVPEWEWLLIWLC
jgi:hypothetical protein